MYKLWLFGVWGLFMFQCFMFPCMWNFHCNTLKSTLITDLSPEGQMWSMWQHTVCLIVGIRIKPPLIQRAERESKNIGIPIKELEGFRESKSVCAERRAPFWCVKKRGGGQDGRRCASPFAAHLRTAQCASRRACGQVHKGAEPEEHAGRLVLSPLRARSSSWVTAAAPRLLSKIYESEAAAPQGINMTELGKKRLLIVVDVLCVFVGEWLTTLAVRFNMAESEAAV